MAALDDALMKAGNDAGAAMELSDERRTLQVWRHHMSQLIAILILPGRRRSSRAHIVYMYPYSLSSRAGGVQKSADELYAEWERLEAIVAEGAGAD